MLAFLKTESGIKVRDADWLIGFIPPLKDAVSWHEFIDVDADLLDGFFFLADEASVIPTLKVIFHLL